MIVDPERFAMALAAIDAANAEDPNREAGEPKELLYGRRMSAMLARFAPQASEPVLLAARAQHVRRWMIPRRNYPMDRAGYLRWRAELYRFHAEQAGSLLAAAGYDTQTIARVQAAVGKRVIRENAEAQLLEDVAGLVFLEHYLDGFAAAHPGYDEEKWLGILRKTWRKLSPAARRFVLDGKVVLPEALEPLVLQAAEASSGG